MRPQSAPHWSVKRTSLVGSQGPKRTSLVGKSAPHWSVKRTSLVGTVQIGTSGARRPETTGAARPSSSARPVPPRPSDRAPGRGPRRAGWPAGGGGEPRSSTSPPGPVGDPSRPPESLATFSTETLNDVGPGRDPSGPRRKMERGRNAPGCRPSAGPGSVWGWARAETLHSGSSPVASREVPSSRRPFLARVPGSSAEPAGRARDET